MNHTIKRNEIYYADLSPVQGSEQDGIRPVLIIQNDIGNKHSPTTIIAPITSIQKKTYLPTHVFMGTDILPKDSYILLEHIRAIDKTRLRNFIGRIEASTIKKVNQAICISLDIKRRKHKMTERNCLSMLKNEPEVMTVIEAAKVLRLGKNKTYDLISSGRLSSIKVGGKIIVPKMCLVSFLTDTKNYQFSPV